MTLDVRNLQRMMKQMNTQEIPAEKVEFHLSGGRKLVIEKPSVVKMEVMGQINYQVSGNAREVQIDIGPSPASSAAAEEGDADLVSSATGSSKEDARAALSETGGDIAAAILKLKK